MSVYKFNTVVASKETYLFFTDSTIFHTVSPKILPFTFGERPLNAGQLVTVPCAVVEGDAPISLQWLFNNQTIAPRHRITIVELGDRNVILSIASVDEKHVGNYTCVARNLAGHHNITAPLLVNGKALFPFLFM